MESSAREKRHHPAPLPVSNAVPSRSCRFSATARVLGLRCSCEAAVAWDGLWSKINELGNVLLIVNRPTE